MDHDWGTVPTKPELRAISRHATTTECALCGYRCGVRPETIRALEAAGHPLAPDCDAEVARQVLGS